MRYAFSTFDSFATRLIRCATLALFIVCVWWSNGCSVSSASVRRSVGAVLSKQQAAWNRGDIDGFMQGYWQSDDLTFSSGGSTTRGWRATRDRYKKRYDSPEKMGRLSFDEIETRPLAADAALVLGRWRLDRDMNSIGGRFTLIFRYVDRRWVIVHDHTSARNDNGGS